jgi:alanine racemase
VSGSRPTWVEVDLDAIRHNVAVLAAHASASALMAVVKADGYGHGAVPVATAALEAGASWLGVALVEEGLALRAAGITAPVLLLIEPPAGAARHVIDAGLTPVVWSREGADALAAAAGNRPVDVHVKLDTGVRRWGVPRDRWEAVLGHLAGLRGVRVSGLMSHLAVADEPGNPYTEQQVRAFAEGRALADDMGLRPELVHLCNSAGTLLHPELHHDLVRVGIALYGLEPAPGIDGGLPLRAALSWRSKLGLVKRLQAGDSVSYGRRWTAEHPTTVGTIPAGYADGVPRALTNRGTVVHAGRRVPMVGTVCMDAICVDLGDADARVGDDVWLIGPHDAEQRVRAEDWAEALATITYEVTTRIGPRVPRTYLP